MTRKLFNSFISLIIICNSVTAQTYWIPKTPFLDSLYNWDKSIGQITQTEEQSFLPITINGVKTNQNIIKEKKSIYILIDGTGQVYKASAQNSTQIAFTRIDYTFYFGYNFNAIDFVYKDTIFSFGGDGFWHYNGQLRYFKPGYDWNIILLNEQDLASKKSNIYLPEKSKIFYFETDLINQITNQKKEYATINELNLTTKTNKILGKLNFDFSTSSSITANIPKLNAILQNPYNFDLFLLNPVENTVYKLKKNNNKYYDALFPKTNAGKPCNFFALGDTLYFTQFPNYELHSVVISMQDFDKEPYPLYVPITTPFDYYKFSTFLLIISILSYFIIRYALKRKKKKDDEKEESQPILSNDEISYTSIEIDILKSLIKYINGNGYCSVDHFHSQLGVTYKSIDVQKKSRNEFINVINAKFRSIYKKEEDLIIREKDENDKRTFKYIISQENLALLNEKFT